MPSYLVTGANRGIGLALVRQLSDDKSNIVIGTFRDKSTVNADSIGDLISRDNLHWVQLDVADRKSIDAAVPEVSAVTGGKLDVLIANAGIVSEYSSLDGLTELADENPAAVEEDMLQCFRVNVVGQVFLFRAFLPLVKAGSLKKIIGISTGYADIELNADYDLYQAAPYSISKVAFNMAITKIQAEHRKDGVLLMSVSPGVVDTGHAPTPDKGEKAMILGQKFGRYAPDFKGPITPAESAALVLDVIDKATLEASGGRHVSQFGNTRWL